MPDAVVYSSSGGQLLSNARADQLFPVLTPAQIARIAAFGRTRVVAKGEVLAEAGDPAPHFLVVTEGEIEVRFPSPTGEEVVGLFSPGTFTGEVQILSGRRSSGRVRAT